MTRKAYHTLILPDGTEHQQVIVDFDDDGQLVSFHPLTKEEPFVEWVGGTLDLRFFNV